MSQHLYSDNVYARRGQEDVSNSRIYKRTKVSKKEACCLCPFSFNTYYVALLLCRAVSSERVQGHSPSRHGIPVYLVLADHLDLCKNPQSKVSTSRRDFYGSFI